MRGKKFESDEFDSDNFDGFNEDQYNLKNVSESNALYFDPNQDHKIRQAAALRAVWKEMTAKERQILTELGNGLTVQELAFTNKVEPEDISRLLSEIGEKIKYVYDELDK